MNTKFLLQLCFILVLSAFVSACALLAAAPAPTDTVVSPGETRVSPSTTLPAPSAESEPTLDGFMAMATVISKYRQETATAEPLHRQATETDVALHRTPLPSRPLLAGARFAYLQLPNEIASFGDVYVGSTEKATPFLLGKHGGAPVWSPSGQQIAYPGGCVPAACLTIVNADGTNRRQVDSWFEHPVWSPDGCSLFGFVAPGTIVEVNADGSNLDAFSGYKAAWLPDGQHIVYSSANSIYESDADRKNAQVLISGKSVLMFELSPDGSRLAYKDAAFNGVYILDLATKQRTQIAQSGEMLPVWSPDGQQLAVIGTVGGDFDESLPGPLTIFKADGSGARVLAKDAVNPAWSPDGQQIAYDTGSLSDHKIHVVNVDGSGDRTLYDGGNPAWAPIAKKTKC